MYIVRHRGEPSHALMGLRGNLPARLDQACQVVDGPVEGRCRPAITTPAELATARKLYDGGEHTVVQMPRPLV